MILLPGARTLLLPATRVPTPATAHETLCPQTAPTSEEVMAAGALDRYLEDLGAADRWLRSVGGWEPDPIDALVIVGPSGAVCQCFWDWMEGLCSHNFGPRPEPSPTLPGPQRQRTGGLQGD